MVSALPGDRDPPLADSPENEDRAGRALAIAMALAISVLKDLRALS
jgi:hypothetical protein